MSCQFCKTFTLLAGCATGAAAAITLPTYIDFTVTVDGAVGTYPSTINSLGVVAGVYSTSTAGVAIGFVRATDGTITTFNPPNSMYIWAAVIEDSGEILGSFQDTNGFSHGYIRNTEGGIQVYDINGSQSFTTVYAANHDAVVAGTYYNGTNQYGFIMNSVSGPASAASFSIPGATELACWGINDQNQVAGDYEDSSGVFHGFIWALGVPLQTFDVPNLTSPGTFPRGINDSEEVAGIAGAGAAPPYGFIRSSAGTITTFAPRITERIYVRGINSGDQVIAYYADSFASDTFHGLIRQVNGLMETFDVPGATSTEVEGINDPGQVTGYYISSSDGLYHGYIRTP